MILHTAKFAAGRLAIPKLYRYEELEVVYCASPLCPGACAIYFVAVSLWGGWFIACRLSYQYSLEYRTFEYTVLVHKIWVWTGLTLTLSLSPTVTLAVTVTVTVTVESGECLGCEDSLHNSPSPGDDDDDDDSNVRLCYCYGASGGNGKSLQ